ncbi:hypothetical protein ACHHYP_20488 [Achlya hypogyna]|uniref:Uncharacterized protein n=1 Tax=Achlya hypogyna TaxID=1202772 RepID=A0A1V9YL29_ACHHY|nr:hypothetical protein ACHHYP_20488 [Achlya hypogyna]
MEVYYKQSLRFLIPVGHTNTFRRMRQQSWCWLLSYDIEHLGEEGTPISDILLPPGLQRPELRRIATAPQAMKRSEVSPSRVKLPPLSARGAAPKSDFDITSNNS